MNLDPRLEFAAGLISPSETLYRGYPKGRLLYLAVGLLLSSSVAGAQENSSPPPPGSNGANTDTVKSASAEEPYVIELLQNKVRFEADGTGSRDLVLKVKVNSESAVREFGLLVYPFAYTFESLDVVYARVLKPDGKIVETPASDVQELDSAVSRQAPMYVDEREKHIAVKSLTPGDTLEINLHWNVHDPIARGHFWYDDNLFRAGACLKEILEINVPRDVPVKMRNTGPQAVVREEGARRIYTFQNTSPKKKEESKIPAWETNYHGINPPEIQITSFASWQEVGDWFSGLALSKAAVSDEIRARALEVTKGKDTEDAKIRALYDFVSMRVRYIGISLGQGRYTPHSAGEVLSNRYGDCKDKHTLFAALLESAGINAAPVLISSSYKIDPDFPTPSLFDHVFTAIPRGNSFLLLDTTPEVAPFALILPQLRNRDALVAFQAGNSRLIKTSKDPVVSNYELFRTDSSIDAKGTLDATMRLEERGDGEVSLRQAYRGTPQNSWQELTQKIVAGMGFGGTVSNVSVQTPEDTSQPFWVTFTYHRADLPDWKDHRIIFPSPPILLPDLNEEQKASKNSLPLGAPQEVTYESKVKFPKGYSPLPPENVDRKYDFAEFSATFALREDTLKGTLHFKTVANEVPGEERSKYTSLAKVIDDTVRRYIFVKSPDMGLLAGMARPGMLPGSFSDASAIPRLEEALKNDPDNDFVLMRLSDLYTQNGRAADAVALLKKTIEEHPDVPDHLHVALGRAYLKTSEVDKAMPEFKQGLKDDTDPNFLNEVAYSLAEAKVSLPEAMEYSAKAVSNLSEQTMDNSAEDARPADYMLTLQLSANWDTLGWIKFEAGDYPGAEKYLKAAWDVMQSGVIGEHLVEAYQKLGKKDKAATICNMALASYAPPNEVTREKLSAEMAELRPFLTRTGGLSSNARSPHSVDGGVALSDLRDLQVPFHTKLQSDFVSANFVVSLSNTPKGNEAFFQSGAKELQGATTALAVLKYPQSFPDDTPTRVLRKGILSCSTYAKNCIFVLTLPTDNAVPIPLNVTSTPTN